VICAAYQSDVLMSCVVCTAHQSDVLKSCVVCTAHQSDVPMSCVICTAYQSDVLMSCVICAAHQTSSWRSNQENVARVGEGFLVGSLKDSDYFVVTGVDWRILLKLNLMKQDGTE
jgi:hypothetical protein